MKLSGTETGTNNRFARRSTDLYQNLQSVADALEQLNQQLAITSCANICPRIMPKKPLTSQARLDDFAQPPVGTIVIRRGTSNPVVVDYYNGLPSPWHQSDSHSCGVEA
jgi:hypothetical protein